MAQQGYFKHYKGGTYTVLLTVRTRVEVPEQSTLLFVAKNSTNGPGEGAPSSVFVDHDTGEICAVLGLKSEYRAAGKVVIVYVSHTTGEIHFREREQFEELVEWPETLYENGGVGVRIPAGKHPRFMCWPEP